MKLNMGCGYKKIGGFVNVDQSSICEPDVVFNLEETPWPWQNNSVEEVQFIHSLEHLGGDPNVFLAIMSELYRVCANNALVRIIVPHPRHDNFVSDPTHVRPITPLLLDLFNKELNDEWKKMGASNTPFAHYLGVDFVRKETRLTLEEPYATQCKNGEINFEALKPMIKEKNNVVIQYDFELRVRK